MKIEATDEKKSYEDLRYIKSIAVKILRYEVHKMNITGITRIF